MERNNGKRISIKDTRGIIDAILNGDIKDAPTKKIPYFNFEVPTELPGVDPANLTYAILMQMLLSGKKKRETLPEDLSRTLQNTKETKQVKHLFQQVRNCKKIWVVKSM